MIRQVTIDKLHEMRLSAMASAFENQCADAATYQDLSFEDRFGMLVDREWEKRKNSKLQKLIRNAEFRYPNASVEAIEYNLNAPCKIQDTSWIKPGKAFRVCRLDTSLSSSAIFGSNVLSIAQFLITSSLLAQYPTARPAR